MLCKGHEGHLENVRMTKWAPDEELMLQVRAGASESLGVLFDRYQKPLFNFYSKMTGNRTVSEDLVQEVFLRLLKYRQSYTPGTPFRAWVYQIARNARFDQLRKQRPEAELSAAREGFTLPGDPAQRRQESSLLHQALLQLPEEKREVLVMSRFQDLKYEEIARLVGCEVGAVKVRVYRALQELKESFRRLEASGSARALNAAGEKQNLPRGAGHGL